MPYPGWLLTGTCEISRNGTPLIHKEQGESMKRIFSEMKSLRYALLAFAATALLLGGCSGGGGSSYDAPDTTSSTAPVIGQTQNVLIDAATLKSWVDSGLVNNTASYEKVVILHNSGYATEHIPGAQEWSRSGIDRYDGPVLSGNMVLDGETKIGRAHV